MPNDIEIARAAALQRIGEVAAQLGLADDAIEHYGCFKAEIITNRACRPLQTSSPAN